MVHKQACPGQRAIDKGRASSSWATHSFPTAGPGEGEGGGEAIRRTESTSRPAAGTWHSGVHLRETGHRKPQQGSGHPSTPCVAGPKQTQEGRADQVPKTKIQKEPEAKPELTQGPEL